MISGSVDEILLEPRMNDVTSTETEALAHPRSRPESRSRIPILRDGSPLRSRPGSRANNSRPASRSASRGGAGARADSEERKRPSPSVRDTNATPKMAAKPEVATVKPTSSRRALPLTPKTRRRETQPQSTSSYGESTVTSRKPLTSQPDTSLSQAESEMTRATRLLLMNDDEIRRTANKSPARRKTADDESQDVISELNTSSSPLAKPKTRERSPGKEATTSEWESGGEELSQGSTASKRELKSRYIEEVNSRKQNEETLQQLQQEYSTLLKKYAEAENVIDDLRLGAKVRRKQVTTRSH